MGRAFLSYICNPIIGPVVQWIEYLPAGRQGSFLTFDRGSLPAGTQGFLEKKMITVYAIRSEVNGDIYVGIAKDSDRRLKEHNSGKNRYTKGLRPWKKIYTELQLDWQEARKREKYLKSGVGKEFLKSLVP